MSVNALMIFAMLLAIADGLSLVTTDSNITSSETECYAHIARKLVYSANWAVLGTTYSGKNINKFPLVNLVAVSDGAPNGQSTGYLFFQLSNQSLAAQDIQVENKMTLLVMENDDLSCSSKSRGSLHPLCTRAMISGCAVKLRKGTNEYALGLRAYGARHPVPAELLQDPSFSLYKIIVQTVMVTSYLGKEYNVPLRDYYTYN